MKAAEAVKAVSPDTGIFEGRICSGDQFIASKEQKKRIIEQFGGYCAEMEGAAIAQVCHLNHIPFVIIRAISDKADDSEEVSFEIFAKKAAAISASAVIHMIEN
jgi:adenosylhomocysteine nucleosidase